MKIYRCNVCGYIYNDKEAPCECPFCRNKNVFNEVDPSQLSFDFFKQSWQLQVTWMNNTKYQNEISLNPDDAILFSLASAMEKSLKDGKQAYCPCRVLTGNELADKKIICPCYLYMGEIELQDRCHCSLYVTDKWIKDNK